MWEATTRLWVLTAKAVSSKIVTAITYINTAGVVYSKWLVNVVSTAIYLVKTVIAILKILVDAYIDGQQALARAVFRLARLMWDEEQRDVIWRR